MRKLNLHTHTPSSEFSLPLFVVWKRKIKVYIFLLHYQCAVFLVTHGYISVNPWFPIAFAIIEGETTEAWFFFLKNLRTHVTPQQNLCLMSDRHNLISAAFNKPSSGWTEGNCLQVFCI